VFVLGLLGAALTACGGSNSTTTGTTTTTTSATTSTSGAASGANSAICTQAIQSLQPVSVAARANPNNPEAVLQAAKGALPQLQSLAGQATGSTKSALNNLVASLQAIENGARGPSASNAVAGAAVQLGNSCAASP
jgi:hypothetical protein